MLRLSVTGKEDNMASRTNFTIRDYSNELSSFGVVSVTGTAANLDAQLAAAAALSSAIENLTIGHLDKYAYQIFLLDSPITPSNVYAQREVKWLVSYTGDTSGKTFQVEIAAPDLTGNIIANTDQADLTSTDWAAFVTAFEAYARSPDNGTETVTVQSARIVGRNI
jgi:hypothetical protein